jgi:hypothetical protein
VGSQPNPVSLRKFGHSKTGWWVPFLEVSPFKRDNDPRVTSAGYCSGVKTLNQKNSACQFDRDASCWLKAN